MSTTSPPRRCRRRKPRYGDAYQFAGPDGVHPEQDCSLVIAYAYLKALGCDGAIGTLTVDYAAKQATADPAQQIVSYQDGTLTVKSTRYPFCFPGQPDQPNFSAAAILKDIPFNDDLNRYLLVVKGLTTPKAKITWGATSKEFASTDLAKGINLAAEFLQNPFCDQFNQVWHSVLLQQSQGPDSRRKLSQQTGPLQGNGANRHSRARPGGPGRQSPSARS